MYARIYGIFDSKAENVLGPLMFFSSDAAASRTFVDIVRDEKSQVFAHPEDYDLRFFGTLIPLSSDKGCHIDPVLPADVILTGAHVVAVDTAKASGQVPQLALAEA